MCEARLTAGAVIAAAVVPAFVMMTDATMSASAFVATLGIVGFLSSMLIRMLGRRLMRWREQTLGFAG